MRPQPNLQCASRRTVGSPTETRTGSHYLVEVKIVVTATAPTRADAGRRSLHNQVIQRDASSFSALFTRVEIGHFVMSSAG